MKKASLASLALASIALVGCGESTQSSTVDVDSTQSSTVHVDSMLFSKRKQMLANYRSSDEMCSTDSVNCMAWTGMALKCELSLVEIDKGNYENPYRGFCTQAEEFREAVTGIEISSAPGAFVF